MEPFTTTMMVTGGMQLLGGILQGLTYKPQNRNLTPSEKHIEYMVGRYRDVRDQREAAANYASAFTGLPKDDFLTTAGQISLTDPNTMYGSKEMEPERIGTRNISVLGQNIERPIYGEMQPVEEKSGRQLYQESVAETERKIAAETWKSEGWKSKEEKDEAGRAGVMNPTDWSARYGGG